MNFYLIKRGPRPDYHKAPFHPVLICAKRAVAKWQAGCSGDKAWVWEGNGEHGWLLARWNGFDVDYGHVVHSITMPDGVRAGFYHERDKEPWTLLNGAIWWDAKSIPKILQELGVITAPDEFTQKRIRDDLDFCRNERRHKA
jgi:hypothetical protein